MSVKSRANKPKVKHRMHVKKGDTVQIISGKEKGKIGKVLKAIPEKSQVVVEDANVKTKHIKPRQEGEQGQIDTYPAPIHSSNVMHYSTKQNVASRIGYQVNADGKKVRVLKKTGEVID
jgi:large subunit ribosomal protein L24